MNKGNKQHYYKKKRQNDFEIGRKQGALEELKRLLNEIDFSQNRAECSFCKTIEQVNGFIEYNDFEKHIEKRIKELEGGVSKDE